MQLDSVEIRAYKLAIQKAKTFSRLAGRKDNPPPLVADMQRRWVTLSEEQKAYE